ncbi:Doublecortin [Novymonas esmeraldas]|uniref:Doublecortin n=1 Tax=Novymonas esmeraldas TaxID=1808958 RepID=A0AAW0F4T2_9TRYP
MSTAARREEIQRQLHQLRETREREQAAFDAVAAAHPELSAHEITALAHKAAAAEAPQSLAVNGVEVRVGERVGVRDDLQLLHRADRGHFAADPLKPVYLGERGEVVRVMSAFQGKPAVELRFADGVIKVFFAECLDVGHDGAGDARSGSRHADPTDAVGPTAKMPLPPPPPPKAEALPGWGQLRMPHRRSSATVNGDTALAAPALPPPPPPPTTAAVRVPAAKHSPPAPARASSSAASAPAASTPAVAAPTVKATAAVVRRVGKTSSTATAVVRKAPPGHVRRSTSPRHVDTPLAAPPAAPVAQPCLLPSAVAEASSGEEGLGSPMSFALHEAAPRRPSAAADSEGVPDLRPTPGSSTCEMDAAAAAPGADELRDEVPDLIAAPVTRLQEACATPTRAALDTQGEAAAPELRPSSTAVGGGGTRFCWLAGLDRAGGDLSAPVRIALKPQCTTMFAVFAVATQKLRWDKQRLAATRLFSERGAEIRSAAAVRDGMCLVATTGCAYEPGSGAAPFASVGDARPPPTTTLGRPAAAAAAKTVSAQPATPAAPGTGGASAPLAAAPAAASPKTAPRRTAAAAAPRRVPPPPTAAARPIHIRVYENGLYDDNVYRTVTVRPTYKTLGSLKTVITRELQWRDGKKVDLLFDATGAEVAELADLVDGDAVVASAGDRFVIPFPNTAFHKEAMRLAARLR